MRRARRASGSVTRSSIGQGSRHVQFSSFTTAGTLTRSRQPNRSWNGTMTMSDPAQNSACEQRVADAGVEGRVGIAAGLAQPGNLGAQMALAPVGAVPPLRERVGVVRAADGHRFGGVIRRPPERLTGLCHSRSQRSTFSPGTLTRASDSRTKSGTTPRSSAMMRAPVRGRWR